MNLPNKLTVVRVFMIPAVIAAIMLGGVIPGYIAYPLAALIFGAASFTDFLDGKIARSRGLITDFGKFMDPLADKLMVIGTMLTVLYKFEAIRPYFFWAVLIVIFREFMVTGIRLIAVSAPGGQVIAANKLGKIKTVTQIICVLAVLVEPAAQDVIARRGCPAWVEVDGAAFKGVIKALPQRDDIQTPIEESLIVELYSK